MATRAGCMPDNWFRVLDADEQKTFRLWARENWEAGKDPESTWHPVVREEWAAIDAEHGIDRHFEFEGAGI